MGRRVFPPDVALALYKNASSILFYVPLTQIGHYGILFVGSLVNRLQRVGRKLHFKR